MPILSLADRGVKPSLISVRKSCVKWNVNWTNFVISLFALSNIWWETFQLGWSTINLSKLHLKYWCKCGKCSLESLEDAKECWCCTEMEGCMLWFLSYALITLQILEYFNFCRWTPKRHVLFSFKTSLIKGISTRCHSLVCQQGRIAMVSLLAFLIAGRKNFEENFPDCGLLS